MTERERWERDYPIAGRLANWRFKLSEPCTGVWEVSGADLKGRIVSRTGTADPELVLEECVADAMEMEHS